MADIRELLKAVDSINSARSSGGATECDEVTRFVNAARSLGRIITSMKLSLLVDIKGYLDAHPELSGSDKGLSDIFGLLVAEEHYSRCLGWLLDYRNCGIRSRELLNAILSSVYPEKRDEIDQQTKHDYSVACEYWIESGSLDIYINSTQPTGFMAIIENKIIRGTEENKERLSEEGEIITPAQLVKYQRWADRQQCDNKWLIFLCLDDKHMHSKDTGFRPLRWRQLIPHLRTMAETTRDHQVSTVLNLMIADLERLTSELRDYIPLLGQMSKSSTTCQAVFRLDVLQDIDGIIRQEMRHVGTD